MPPPTPHNSSTPLISTADRQNLEQTGTSPTVVNAGEKDLKGGKRRLFGLGKKKEDNQTMDAPSAVEGTIIAEALPSISSPLKQQQQQQPDPKAPAQPIPVSPSRQPYHPSLTASPSLLRSGSPRLHSPASSEIFERNVQEPIPISTLGGELSPAHIPAHMITEDSIPPALEASAQAITSEELNPDEVEIVTSASHQPAAATLEGSASHADLTSLGSPLHQPPSLHHERSGESDLHSSLHHSSIAPGLDDDSASNYGQLDPNDVRRLSFISFKDIVQSEHQHAVASSLGEVGSRDSLHMSSLPPSVLQENRAASPFHPPQSPTSTHSPSQSGGLTTPPMVAHVSALTAHPEQSPVRSVVIGSPGVQHGELTIETMRQALRKTASGDLGGVRSSGMSPSGEDNPLRDALRNRTNA